MVLSVENPSFEIGDGVLRDIIYFASNHAEKIELEPLADRLVAIYKSDEDIRMRVMAVVALEAIGSRKALESIRPAYENSTSHLLRHVTEAAFREHQVPLGVRLGLGNKIEM